MVKTMKLIFPIISFILSSAPVEALPSSKQQYTLVNHDSPNFATEQNSTLCDAGSRQWTGLVPVSSQSSLFYWFFESRSSPENDPLIIWVNGGPGASSLIGLFHEIGPCEIIPGKNSTKQNSHSWTNVANVLFVDQPIGAGLSRSKNDSHWVSNINEAAIDFNAFLDAFLDQFPRYQDTPIHFAGESFGGHYVPHYIAQSKRKFQSMILVNALLDIGFSTTGIWDHMCAPASGKPFSNDTTCASMARDVPKCEKLAQVCRNTDDIGLCQIAGEVCTDNVASWFFKEVVKGGWNPYDDRLRCEKPPLCGGLGFEEIERYLGLDSVQRALGVRGVDFESVNMDLNMRWALGGDVMTSSTRQLEEILNRRETNVLFINGNNDIIVSTEGQIRMLDSVPWSGQAPFRAQGFVDWFYVDVNGGRMRAGSVKTQGKLALMTVDGAGHEVPHYQPQAILQVVDRWMRHPN